MKKNKQQAPTSKENNAKGNAGSGSFNQGSKQEPDYKNGVQVSDEEKRTGKPPSKTLGKNQNSDAGTNQ